jgi:hypothetical protein
LRIEGKINMNDIYSLSTLVLAHVIIEWSNKIYAYLAVISLFVFGLLLCRKVVRIPKGLFISSFISYVLLLVNILILSFNLPLPLEVVFPFFAVGIWPSYLIVGYIEVLAERLFGSGFYDMFDETIAIYLVAFIVNTLCIFGITRLILYIDRKGSAKKPQVKQAV